MFRGTNRNPRLFSWLWRSERNPLREPQDAAAKFDCITLHPKGGSRKWARRASRLQQVYESKGIAGLEALRPVGQDVPLDNSRDNEYYTGMAPASAGAGKLPRRWVRGQGFS